MDPSPNLGTARAALLRETRCLHDALHRLPDFRALLEGELTPTGYAVMMDRIHAFYAAADPAMAEAVARFGRTLGDYSYLPRASAFDHDRPCVDPTGPAGTTARFPALSSAAATAGAAYVLDGALLGAATLDRAVGKLMPRPRGSRFWRWSRLTAKSQWPATLALIERLDARAGARASMVAAANAVFDAFGQAMDRPPVGILT